MDARDMAEFEAESFDAVIDKGMTDAIMFNDKFALMMAKVIHLVPFRTNERPIPNERTPCTTIYQSQLSYEDSY